ncbi:hypothetical protein [uncultured Sphingomonas sp.]|uniref:hypothetical protein n=1 Tax=uncultured Sphingomonas sp. TaxID=158754 RepID=UPI002610972B|nr:hypothetical protein [uncultured Sphingomonas sp.]
MAGMTASCCGKCRFWKQISDDDERGYCKKAAPTIISGMIAEAARDYSSEFDLAFGCTMFPATDVDDWCGEFAVSAEYA